MVEHDRALQLQAEGMEYDAHLYYANLRSLLLNYVVKGDRALQLQAEGMEYDASLYYAVGDRCFKNYPVKCDRTLSHIDVRRNERTGYVI